MKATSVVTGLVLSLLTSAALAGPKSNCGGDYEGDLETAQSIQNKTLNCNSNNVSFRAVLQVSIPRCLDGQPLVELINKNDSSDKASVISIRTQVIHGTARTFAKYHLETVQSDLPIICVLQK